MLNEILGQEQAVSILRRLLREKSEGRTLILLGERGIGKFSLALNFAEEILCKNPFLSTDFLFYRNDDFSLKTRYFLNNLQNEKMKPGIKKYFYYLLGRISSAYTFGEIGKSTLKFKKDSKSRSSKSTDAEIKSSASYSINDFRMDLEETLLNGTFYEILESGSKKGDLRYSSLRENLISISDDITKKQKIPIDFIRSLIEYNSQKSTQNLKISIIGNFENATDEAQNSSLKLFEEPSRGNMIILTADTIAPILPTILSRSIIIKMKRLSPKILKGIFGNSMKPEYFHTTDLMEDEVYNYCMLKKDRVVEFFRNIAPSIQYDNAVFGFIEELASEQNNKLAILFMEELLEFLRNLHLARQEYIRKQDFQAFIDPGYREITSRLVSKTFTSEIRELSDEIAELLQGVKYRNITDTAVLPSVLIDLARWYQRRSS